MATEKKQVKGYSVEYQRKEGAGFRFRFNSPLFTESRIYLLTAVTHAVIHLSVQISAEFLLSILLGIYLEVKLLDHVIILFKFSSSVKWA